MDSNDFRRSHWNGGCGAPMQEMVEHYKRLIEVLGSNNHGPLVLEELVKWPTSTDVYWQRTPEGPPRLHVLRDELAEEGLTLPARVLASALFMVHGPAHFAK